MNRLSHLMDAPAKRSTRMLRTTKMSHPMHGRRFLRLPGTEPAVSGRQLHGQATRIGGGGGEQDGEYPNKSRRQLLLETGTAAAMLRSESSEASGEVSLSARTKAAEDAETGIQALRDPLAQSGCATSAMDRQRLRLDGLLPPRVSSADVEVARCMKALRLETSQLARYRILICLQQENLTAFVQTITEHADEVLPIIYTPTVGEACINFGTLYPRPLGLYISHRERGRIRTLLQHWPHKVDTVVVTDGERVLGLGDLGAHGMGIVCGKALVYTAATGISPTSVLPLTIDVGTNNQQLLEDPFYLGERENRIPRSSYDQLVEELVDSLAAEFGNKVLIHLEDFSPANAFGILQKYRERRLIFDDDVQCTAAVVVAALMGAFRLMKGELKRDLTSIVFFGAGQANLGTASVIVDALMDQGVSEEDALSRIWMLDSKGLIYAGRDGVTPQKRRFQRPFLPNKLSPQSDLQEVVQYVQPCALVGAASIPGSFTPSVIRTMSSLVARPIIFSLSNPNSRTECTAEEAYTYSSGRAIFASGSPFDPVELDSRRFCPSQANNALVFPGLAQGLRLANASRVDDEVLRAASEALSSLLHEEDMRLGRVLPTSLRESAQAVAKAVAEAVRNARKPNII